MREGRALAAFALLTACASGTRARPRDRVSPTTIATRDAASAPATDDALPLADWLPQELNRPAVIREDAREALLIDGPFRAIVHHGGRIEVARDRTRLAIARWFSLPDDQWVFVTVDGIVVSSRGFTGAFETRADLPSALSELSESDDSDEVVTPVVKTADGRWWVLDEPAHPRALAMQWADNVLAMRFYARDRALAIVSPGRLLHSDDGARSFAQIALQADSARALERAPSGAIIVQGVRQRWAIDRNGVFGRVLSEPARAAIDGPVATRTLERWSEYVTQRVPRVFVDPLAPTLATLGERRVALLSTLLGVFARGRRPVLQSAEMGNDCALFPFGTALAALCEHATERSRFRLIHADDAVSIDAVETAVELQHNDVFATDGTVVARMDVMRNAVTVWTPSLGWRTHALSEQFTLLDAANGQLFASNERGLFSLRVDQDGDPTLREIARFDRGADDAGVSYARALASSAHGSLRAWVVGDAEFTRCAVLLEDREGASTIALPRCTDIRWVQFVDRRFGVVATTDTFLVTRDARTWSTHSRAVMNALGRPRVLPEYRNRAGWQSTRPFVFEQAVIVPPAHRVTRDERDRAIARSVSGELMEEAPPRTAPSAPTVSLTCRTRATRVDATMPSGATVLLHGSARVSIEPPSSGDSIAVRWSVDGRERGAWRGARPWSADAETRWRIACASDVGVVVERCLDAETQDSIEGEACRVWLLRAGSIAPLELALDGHPATASVTRTQCQWAENAWQIELPRTSDGMENVALAQFQRRSADGTMLVARDVVRSAHFSAAMVTGDGEGYWAEQRSDAELRVVPYVRGYEWSFEAIRSLEICRGADDVGARLHLGDSGESAIVMDEQRSPIALQLQRRSGGYCIESVLDESARTREGSLAASPALTVRATRDGLLRGTLSTLDDRQRITRAEVQCTAQISARR